MYLFVILQKIISDFGQYSLSQTITAPPFMFSDLMSHKTTPVSAYQTQMSSFFIVVKVLRRPVRNDESKISCLVLSL